MLCYISVADIVLWSPEAKVYVVVADRNLDVYSVEVGRAVIAVLKQTCPHIAHSQQMKFHCIDETNVWEDG